jgi:Family of unknown function (DUF6982)/PilZ domain
MSLSKPKLISIDHLTEELWISRGPREKPRRERRAATRHGEDRLQWVRVARLQFGQWVSLVDLSTGGARLDSPVGLRPSAVSSLEISGAGVEIVVPIRVLRCEVSGLSADGVTYRGACEFMRPIEIPNVMNLPVPLADPDDMFELDVVLKNLVRRASGDTEIGRFSNAQLLHALTALHLRAANLTSDPIGQRLDALLTLVLPAACRGTGLAAVLPGIETQLRRVVPGATVRFSGAASDGAGPNQNSILIENPGTTTGPLVSIDLPKRLTMTRWQHRVTTATARVIAILQRLEPDRSINVLRVVKVPAVTPAPISERVQPARAIMARDAALNSPAPAARATDTAAAETGSVKVVVRYTDGHMLKGYTPDFHASRTHFTLCSESSRTADAVIVPFVRLKAVFFVRDFAGDPEYVECKQMPEPGPGRRIEVTLHDGEIIVGTTLNYQSGGQGFFVTPLDPHANNIRVFVVAQSVRQVRFPTRVLATA